MRRSPDDGAELVCISLPNGTYRLLSTYSEQELMSHCDNMAREIEAQIDVLAALGRYGRRRWHRQWRSGQTEFTTTTITRGQRPRDPRRTGDTRADSLPNGRTDLPQGGEGAR
jgi:hypothetical protein